MAQIGAHHSDGDIGAQVFKLSRPACLQEIVHVRTSIATLGLLLAHGKIALLALVHLEALAIQRHPAFGAIEEIAYVIACAGACDAALASREQSADFEDNLA